MSKTAIGWFYFSWLIIEILLVFLFLINDVQQYNNYLQRVATEQSKIQSDQSSGADAVQIFRDQEVLSPDQDQLTHYQKDLVTTIQVMAGISLLVLPAWIGTLVNLARAQLWTWFALTFFFGGISVFIYLLAGPSPLKVGQAPQATISSSPGGPPAPSLAYQQPGLQIPQPHPSALEVLQLRLARGEIDEQTYQRLRDTLKS